MSATTQPAKGFPYAEGDDPYANSPEARDDSACDCNGAWHARFQHCVDWPCPGCDRLCPLEQKEVAR